MFILSLISTLALALHPASDILFSFRLPTSLFLFMRCFAKGSSSSTTASLWKSTFWVVWFFYISRPIQGFHLPRDVYHETQKHVLSRQYKPDFQLNRRQGYGTDWVGPALPTHVSSHR